MKVSDEQPETSRFKVQLWSYALEQPIISVILGMMFIGYLTGTYISSLPQIFVFGGLDGSGYWRLVTPIFLHFGIIHFVFNALWLALLGAKVERYAGHMQCLILILCIAVFSNVGQYLWSGSVRFGGMSGVIYGLLGYLWVHHWLAPNYHLFLPKELVGFMLLWLVICMSGVLDYALGISVANAAHFVGLLTGMFLGFVFGFMASRSINSI